MEARKLARKLLLLGSVFISSVAVASDTKFLSAIYSLLFDDQRVTTNVNLNDDVMVVDANDKDEILDLENSNDGQTIILAAGDLSDSVSEGDIISVLPGTDDRFPIGFAGKVKTKFEQPNRSNRLNMEPVGFADVVEESKTDIKNAPLMVGDFIGVITPNAVTANQNAQRSFKQSASTNETSFLGGGIKVIPKTPISGRAAKSAVDITGTLEVDKISLELAIELGQMGDGVQASTMQPVDVDTPIGFEISGELSNIALTAEHDFSLTEKLKSLNLRIDSDFEFDVKFNGTGNLKLGYFSQAWNEVDDQVIDILGISAKLSGLSSDDKIGKYPLTGLVWSVSCPSTCPVVAGTTQTPLRQAKALGLILWLYLTLDGEYTINGEFSLAKLNPSELSLGLTKVEGGDLTLINSLTPKPSTDRIFVAPSVSGEFESTITGGISTDLDFFASGVRIASAGLDAVAQYNMSLEGDFNWGTQDFGQPWSAQGNACLSRSIGAGFIARAAVDVGVTIETLWSSNTGEFKYDFQIPTDEEMDLPGRHGAWFRSPLINICLPTPVISSLDTTLDGQELTARILGSHLPDDLELMEANGLCTDVTLQSYSQNEVVFTCTAINGDHRYIPSSNKAFNLDYQATTGLEVVIDIPDPTSLNSGLIAHYSFEDNFLDISDNGHEPLTTNELPSFIAGVRGRAAIFNGIDEYLEVPSTAALRSGYYSLSAWVRTEQLHPRSALLSALYSEGTTASPASGYQINLGFSSSMPETEGTIGAESMTRPDGNWGARSTNKVNDRTWRHVVATFDGSVSRVYIDGEQSGIFEADDFPQYFPGPVRWTAPYKNFLIGKNGDNKRTGYALYAGSLDEFRIYSRAISRDEVKELYELDSEGAGYPPLSVLSSLEELPYTFEAIEYDTRLIYFDANGRWVVWDWPVSTDFTLGATTENHPGIDVVSGGGCPSSGGFCLGIANRGRGRDIVGLNLVDHVGVGVFDYRQRLTALTYSASDCLFIYPYSDDPNSYSVQGRYGITSIMAKQLIISRTEDGLSCAAEPPPP